MISRSGLLSLLGAKRMRMMTLLLFYVKKKGIRESCLLKLFVNCYILYTGYQVLSYYMIENQSDALISQSGKSMPKPSAKFLSKLIDFSLRNNLMHKFTPQYITDLIPIARLQEWSMEFARSKNNSQASKIILKHQSSCKIMSQNTEQENTKLVNTRLSLHIDNESMVKDQVQPKHKQLQNSALRINQQEKTDLVSAISLIQFVALMCSSVSHTKDETLFLILSLIDMYSEIQNRTNCKYRNNTLRERDLVEYGDITDYLCEKIVNAGATDGHNKLQIRASQHCVNLNMRPQEEKENNKHRESTGHDSQSPIIVHLYDQILPHICREQVNLQKSLKSPIMRLELNYNTNSQINSPDDISAMVLCSLSSQIELYDAQLKLKYRLCPKSKDVQNKQSLRSSTSSCKMKSMSLHNPNRTSIHGVQYKANDKPIQAPVFTAKEPMITSFAYSRSERRVGCVIYGVGLAFWDQADSYQVHKIMEPVNATFIIYIQYLQAWATVSYNKLSFWNLYEQKQNFVLSLPIKNQIVALTELPTISSLVLSVSAPGGKTLQIHSVLIDKATDKFSSRLLSQIDIDRSGCHTLHFNSATETILQLGYCNNIKVYEFDNLTYEIMSIGNLEGHRTIVTAIQSINKNSIVVTGDDHGEIKMWNLRDLRCFQTLHIGVKEIKQIRSFQSMLFVTDNRLSILKLDYKNEEKPSFSYLACFSDTKLCQIHIFSLNSCSIINRQSGLLQKMYMICSTEQQITAVVRLKSIYYIGTNRGNLIMIDNQFSNKRNSLKLPYSEVTYIKQPDQEEDWLIISGGDMEGFGIWVVDGSMSNIGMSKRLSIGNICLSNSLQIQACSRSNIIALSFTNNYIHILNFQTLDLSQTIKFNSAVSCFKLHPNYPALIVSLHPTSSENGQLFMMLFTKNYESIRVEKIVQLKLYKIFNYTQAKQRVQTSHNNRSIQYFKQIHVNKNGGQMLLITNNNTIQIYDLESAIQSISTSAKNISTNSDNNNNAIFKPVQQTIQNIIVQSSNNISQIQIPHKSQQTVMLQLITSRANVNPDNDLQNQHQRILDYHIDKQIKQLVLLYNQGDLIVLDYRNLSTLCIRKANQLQPSLWTRPIIDQITYKNRVIQAIKLNQKIHTANFRPEIQKFIDYDKIDITHFLQSLVSGEFNQNKNKEVTDGKSQSSDYIHSFEQKYMSSGKHMRNRSTFDRIDVKNVLSLKAMETDKRVRKISCIQQIKPSFKAIAMTRKLSQAVLINNNDIAPIKDPFYRASIQNRLSLQKFEMEPTCELYNKIQGKIQNWKQSVKNKSISSGTVTLPSFSQNKSFSVKNSEKKGIKLLKQNSKLVLQQKIEKLYFRKDKRLDNVRKLFRKDYEQLIKDKR